MKRAYLALFTASVVIMPLMGQTPQKIADINKKVAGKWWSSDRKEYVEFLVNGSCSEGSLFPDGKWHVEQGTLGTWEEGDDFHCINGALRLVEPNTLTQDYGMGGEPTKYYRGPQRPPADTDPVPPTAGTQPQPAIPLGNIATSNDAASCVRNGNIFLASGRFREAFASWDKAIQLGGPATFRVCRGRVVWCDPGVLSLSPSNVNLQDAKGQSVFSVAPSQISTSAPQQHQGVPTPTVSVRAAGKDYSLDIAVRAVQCKNQPFLQCPSSVLNQQRATATYIAHTLQKLAHGSPVAQTQQSSQASAAGRATGKIVVGTFENDGSHYWLVPFLLYDGQHYVVLENGVGPSGIRLANTDYLLSDTGKVNPRSPGAITALKQSVLNSVKEFDLYRLGKKVGHFTVNQISVVTFDTYTKVVGNGVATGVQPGTQDIAVAGPAVHVGFWPDGNLTTAQKREAAARAINMVPKVMPHPPKGMETAQKFSGRRLVFGQPSDNSAPISLTKGGPSAISTELTVPIKSPGEYPGQFSAYVYALQPAPDGSPPPSPVFSSVSITGEGGLDIYGEGSFQLWDCLDIDGDSNAEIILTHSHGEGADIELFTYRSGHLQKILTIGWAGS